MNQAYMRFLEQLLPGYDRSGGDADEARRFIEYADARTRSASAPDTWREPDVSEFARALDTFPTDWVDVELLRGRLRECARAASITVEQLEDALSEMGGLDRDGFEVSVLEEWSLARQDDIDYAEVPLDDSLDYALTHFGLPTLSQLRERCERVAKAKAHARPPVTADAGGRLLG